MYFKFCAYGAPNNEARPNPIELEELPEEYFEFERNSWNDKFRYKTLYDVKFYKNKEVEHLGQVKFGYSGIGDVGEGDYRTIVNNGWYEELDQQSFSLGQSPEYYQNVYSLGNDVSSEYFRKIKDVAFNLDIFHRYRNENIMIHSLLREVSASTVINQFNRISHGGVEITPYNFFFTYKKSEQEGLDETGKIAFEVKPNEKPQTNSHVLIGRNGVGKSFLPKTKYPSLSISDANLIPSCSDCNHDKLNSTKLYINYYFEEIDDVSYMKCYVDFGNEDINFRYELVKPPTWKDDKFNRLKNQFEDTDLLKFYAEQAKIEYSRKEKSFRRSVENSSSYKERLEIEISDLIEDEEEVLGINSLEATLWRGLDNNGERLFTYLNSIEQNE